VDGRRPKGRCQHDVYLGTSIVYVRKRRDRCFARLCSLDGNCYELRALDPKTQLISGHRTGVLTSAIRDVAITMPHFISLSAKKKTLVPSYNSSK
jgi:hypothetical protein